MDRRNRALSLLLVLALCCSAPTRHEVGVGANLDAARPARAHAPRPARIDVEHYGIALVLSPEERSIEGRCRVRFRALEAGLERVTLDLEQLRVSAVRDGTGRPLTWEHFGSELAVTLAAPLGAGEAGELEVEYGGEPLNGMTFAGGHRVPTHVFTRGDLEGARGWFPCWDVPFDRATSELSVDVPASWTVVASGERVDSVSRAERRVERWRTTVPHAPHALALVAGDLTARSGDGEVPVTYLAPDRLVGRVERCLGDTPDALEFLATLSGRRYPFPSYATACIEGSALDGAQSVSVTTLPAAYLGDERALRDRDPIGAVVRGAARQWFGDLVSCAHWSDVWIVEGLAEYAALLWIEDRRGDDAFRARLRDVRTAYLEAERARSRPIVHGVYKEPSDLLAGAHVREGGATRLHLLRTMLGEEAFRAGLRRYVGENRGRAVTTADLLSAFESASGVELEGFAEQWLRSPGFPDVQVRWRWDDARKRVLVSVNQTHEFGDGVPDVFRFPVDVQVKSGAEVRTHRVTIGERRQLVELPAAVEPQWVRFDPRGAVPGRVREEKAAPEWLLLATDGDLDARRDALRALGRLLQAEGGESARARLLHGVVARLDGDAAPSVRAAAARILGGVGGPDARRALVFAARSDAAAEARVAALRALEAWGRDSMLAELARAGFEEGYSYDTMGAAAGLLVTADPDGAYAWLVERAATLEPGEHGELDRALLPQLARTGDPALVDELRRRALDRSADPYARVEAVRLLARAAADDAQVRTELVGLLDSPHVDVRLEAVRALAATDGEDSRRALREHYTVSVSPRERRAIEEVFGR